jgi:hypothetical protein
MYVAEEAAELARDYARELEQREDQLLQGPYRTRRRRVVTVPSGNRYVVAHRIEGTWRETPWVVVRVSLEGARGLLEGATERFEMKRGPATIRWQQSSRRWFRWRVAAVGLAVALGVLLGLEALAGTYVNMLCGFDTAVDPAAGSARAGYCDLFRLDGEHEKLVELGLLVPPVLLTLGGVWLIRRESYRMLAAAVGVAMASPLLWVAAVAALPSG